MSARPMSPRNRWSVLRFAGTTLLVLGFLVADSSLAQEKEGPFRDADDGQLDVGDSLLERNRLLPIPILISEPAVEMGLGLAVAFFHKEKDNPGDRPPRPSISGIAGAYTGNDSWMAGGGHLGYWKQDTIRYTGFGGVGSVNLDFYVSDQPFAYSMDALFLLQDLKFRLGQSNFFLGGRFSYLDVDALFESSDSIPGVDPEAGESTNVSLGAVLHYDTRDNQFTPGRGLGAWLTYSFFDSAFDIAGQKLASTTFGLTDANRA